MLEVNRWTADHQLSCPLSDLLAPLAQAGFDQLELWQYHISPLDDAGLDNLVQKLQAHQIQTPALGAYPTLHLEGAEGHAAETELYRLVEYARRLEVNTLKIFPGRLASAKADSAAWERSVSRLKTLAAELDRSGMRLTLETHGNTLCDTLPSTQRLLAALAKTDNLGLCFQPYTDQDTTAALAAYDLLADHIWHIHLQNRTTATKTMTRLAAGDWIDYRILLPHVRAKGFDQILSLEFTADLFPAADKAFEVQRVIDNAVDDRRFVEALWASN